MVPALGKALIPQQLASTSLQASPLSVANPVFNHGVDPFFVAALPARSHAQLSTTLADVTRNGSFCYSIWYKVSLTIQKYAFLIHFIVTVIIQEVKMLM